MVARRSVASAAQGIGVRNLVKESVNSRSYTRLCMESRIVDKKIS